MRYLVAVDGSNGGEQAFKLAVNLLNRAEDELTIVNVVEDFSNRIFGVSMDEIQRKQKHECKNLLHDYKTRAKNVGVANLKTVMGVSTHEAEFIVRLASSRQVDFLVVGRRGLGTVTRFFAGSTSRYCMENATCNVLIAKAPLYGKDILAKEATTRETVAKVVKEPVKEPVPIVSRQPAMQVDPTIAMEEEERWRRIEEENAMLQKEKADREAAKMGVIIEEEEERKRRIEEEEKLMAKGERAFRVKIYDIA